jgi:superfamily I DNA/RNA helicase
MLLLTFSRRAAAEMQRRIERVTAQAIGPRAGAMADALSWSGTFHAIGARLLREYALDIGLNNSFTIHDREDSADLMNLVRHDLGFSKMEKRFPMKGTCLSIYSRVVNAEAPLDEVLGSFFPWCAEWEAALQKLFGAYVEAKQKQNVLDYDDLVLYWAHIMIEGAIAEDIAGRFDHVLVDEYQDTNRLQASILLGLKPNGRGLTVVGDDAQSIYSFRAATVRNILDFPGHFSPKAEIITLERNYRSTQPILAAANAVIDLASERFTKNLWSERASAQRPRLVNVADDTAQAGYIVERILENREAAITLKSQAGAVPRLAPQRESRSRAHPPQHSLRQIRRAQVSRSRACQGRAGGAALGAKHPRPGVWLPRCATAARDWPKLGRASPRSHDWEFKPSRWLGILQGSFRRGRALGRFCGDPRHVAPERGRLAGGAGSRHPLVQPAPRTHS